MDGTQLILMWTFYAVGITLSVIFIAATIIGAVTGFPLFGSRVPKCPEPPSFGPPSDIGR